MKRDAQNIQSKRTEMIKNVGKSMVGKHKHVLLTRMIIDQRGGKAKLKEFFAR